LYRYDGFNFKAYTHIPGNPNSIPVNAISKICVTKQGLLWIATIEGGIASIDRNGRIIRVINSSTTSLFTKESDYVNDIKEDKDGNIWCSTIDGLFRTSAKGKTDRFRLITSSYKDNAFGDIVFDASGKLWIGSFARGLMIFDPVTKIFTPAANKPYYFKDLKEEKNYYRTQILHNGKLWYSTWAPDIGVYDTAKKRDIILFSDKDLPHQDFDRMVNTFYTDSKNNLWIGTGKGLFFTSGKSSFEKTFLHGNENPYSIINDNITAILQDRDGNFWFGTKEGISIAQPYRKQIKNLSVNYQNQFPFGNKEVNEIIEADSNTLLIGTTYGDGIYQTDANFNLQKKFSFKNKNYDWVWKSYHDKPRHRIFISTYNGMLLYNTKTHSLKKIIPSLHYNINSIPSFAATSDSIAWMSRFRNSFLKYNLKNDTYKEYRLTDLGEQYQILNITTDKEHRIWLLANNTGILQFDERAEKITQRLTSTKEKKFIAPNAHLVF
jgi:ligand-binding sensor domain-containing protein